MRELLSGFAEISRQEARRALFDARKNRNRPLTQIELREAYQIERQVRNEAYVFLGNQEDVLSIDPKGRSLIIKGKIQLQREGKSSSGADLEIFITEHIVVGDIYYEWDTAYAFYRDSVNVSMGMAKGKLGITSKPDIITRQANAKDLTALLKILRGSKPA